MLDAQRFTFYHPHPALLPYVNAYIHLRTLGNSGIDELKKLYPTDYSILSFDQDSRHFDEANNNEGYGYPLCFLGVTDFCRSFTSSPKSLIGIIFKPFGAYRLFGVAQYELANKGTDLTDILPGTRTFSSRLTDDKHDPSQVIQMIEEWLLQRLDRYSEKNMERIAYACGRVRQSKGTMPIRQLCSELGMSETSLRNAFREYVGVSPKTFSRIVKINLILKELQTSDTPDWQDLAYRFRFFDQTHFIKDFKRCCHYTPRQWLYDHSLNLTERIKQGFAP